MNISVIGDYSSPKKYQELLETVKSYKPDENVLDLSRHKKGEWAKILLKRAKDITDSHLIVLACDWHDHFDCRMDQKTSRELHKEIMIEVDGHFLPFPIG